jgi:hypothetical protein
MDSFGEAQAAAGSADAERAEEDLVLADGASPSESKHTTKATLLRRREGRFTESALHDCAVVCS